MKPMDRIRQAREEGIAKIRAIYQDLESRPVSRDCIRRTECCQFHLTGSTPLLTLGEGLLLAKALRGLGRKKLDSLENGICPLLDMNKGRCLAYDDRPFGCRTHFCREAGGPYARKEVLDLIRRLEAIDTELGGDGPHGIGIALAKAIREMSR